MTRQGEPLEEEEAEQASIVDWIGRVSYSTPLPVAPKSFTERKSGGGVVFWRMESGDVADSYWKKVVRVRVRRSIGIGIFSLVLRFGDGELSLAFVTLQQILVLNTTSPSIISSGKVTRRKCTSV